MRKLQTLALLGLMALGVPSCSNVDAWDYNAYAIFIDGSLACTVTNKRVGHPYRIVRRTS